MQTDDRTRIEIKDWMGAIGRRAWLVILIPLLAAFAAGVNQFATPQTFRSIATVTLVDVPTTGPLTAAVTQAVADFQAAVTSIGVLDAAAERANVSRDDVDIVARRVGDGAVVAVVGIGEDRDKTTDMVDKVAREALRAPAVVEAALLEAQIAAQQTLVDEAREKFFEEQDQTNISLNEGFVEDAQNRYSEARDAFFEAQASGADDVTQKEEAYNRWTRVIDDITLLSRLKATVDAREDALLATQIKLSQAEGTRDGVDELRLPVRDAEPLGRITPALRSARAAAVFGLLIALGIVAFLEVGTTRRRQRRETRTRVMEKQRRAPVGEKAARGS
ncbi:MAG: Wzz/FepE/Etk N-terminal domain-containing protein [Actinomycetota bacterium]